VKTLAENKVPLEARWSDFFTRPEWLLFWIIVLAGVILRWASLDAKPYHHDESIHAMFARNFLEHPGHHYFKNDPTYHGPFLYNLLRAVFEVFGATFWSARAPIAAVGSFFMFLPFIFRRYFSKSAVIVLTTAVAFSPTLIYWSRFVIHDFFVLACLFAMVYAVTLAPARLRALIFLTAFALHFAIKANVYVHAAILLGYMLFEVALNFKKTDGKQKAGGSPEQDTLVFRMANYVGRNSGLVLLSLLAALFIYSFFATSGFRYMEGITQNFMAIMTGGWPRYIEYWLGQHQMERIQGPFIYHFYMLSWYELFFTLAFILHLVLFYSRTSWRLISIGLPCFLIGLLLSLYHLSSPDSPVSEVWLWNLFKLRQPMDILAFFVLLSHAVILTIHHLLRGERGLAVSGYIFIATFFTYSYLGEKTPWLSMYPFVAGLVYLTLYFDSLPKSGDKSLAKVICLFPGALLFVITAVFIVQEGFWINIYFLLAALIVTGAGILFLALRIRLNNLATSVFIIFIAFSFRGSLITNYALAGASKEVISQVHTTREFHDLARRIESDALSRPLSKPATMLATGISTWPLTWYMRDVPNFHFHQGDRDILEFDYIFEDESVRGGNIEGYERRRVPLRGWLVPDYNRMTLKKFLKYSLNREAWNAPGYQYMTLHIRE